MRKTKIAVVACAAIMSMSSMSLTTEALGNQTLTSAASTAITSVVELTSSFSSKTVSFKSDYTSTTNAIRLNWNKVSGASGYRIYKYDSSAKKWVKVKTVKSGSTTTARITGLSAGSKYRFKVKAYKHYNGKTYWSNASTAKYAATKPKQVTMKSASASQSAIRLNWKKVKCDGYKIYQKVGNKYKLIATVRDSDTTTYRVTGLSSGTKYTFKVRAYRKDTAGKVVYGKCGVKEKTTKEATAPKTTTITSAKAYTDDDANVKIKLKWNKVDCDGYVILCKDFNGQFRKKIVTDGNVTKAVVSNVCPDYYIESSPVTYTFYVFPYNLNSNGDKVLAEGYTLSGLTSHENRLALAILKSEGTTVLTRYSGSDDTELTSDNTTYSDFNYSSESVKVYVDYEASYELLDKINALRTSQGLSKLTMDKSLLNLAAKRAAEQSFHIGHVRPNGTHVGLSENCCGGAYGGSYDSNIAADDSYSLWYNSNGHKRNLLNSSAKSVGVCVISDDTDFYAVYLCSSKTATKVSQPSNATKTFTFDVLVPKITY